MARLKPCPSTNLPRFARVKTLPPTNLPRFARLLVGLILLLVFV